MLLCPDHGTTPTEGCCKPPCEACNGTGMIFEDDSEGFRSLEFCSCNYILINGVYSWVKRLQQEIDHEA
jgi:hypothetical protein